jgi:acyl-coenzyme A thioesterase PaaI-like protein
MTTMLEQGQKVSRAEVILPPVARLLGFILKALEPGHAVFEMEVDERHHNPMARCTAASIVTWPMQQWATLTPRL